MKTIFNRLGSIRLTLTLLLLLSVAAAFGTVLPRSQDLGAWQNMVGSTGTKAAAALGLTDFYHSVWFAGLLSILLVNLIACMANRLPGILSSLSGQSAIRSGVVVEVPDTESSGLAVAAALRSMGFKSRDRGAAVIHSHGPARLWFTFVTHASIVIIMIFSVFGSIWGFVATKRVYVGDSIGAAYDWNANDDRPLPFELRADDLKLIPNPVAVRVGVLNEGTQHHVKVITTHVGGTFRVPGIKGRITLRKFDVEREEFLASWTSPDGTVIEFGKDQEMWDTGLSLNLLAFATWPERQVRASVTVQRTEAEASKGEISINHPMVVDGIRIFLTDYGRDKFGLPYVGFQFVRDPGQAGVWTGAVLFLLSVAGTVLVRYSCAVVLPDGGRLKVYVSSRESRELIIEQLNKKLLSGNN